MSTKPTDIPKIEHLKFSELVIDTLYSGREKKEITANAKTLAPEIEAFGGWDATQPGQYFVGTDKKKHLCAGFTRIAACEINGLKGGYFVQRDGDETSHLIACITTNGGKPLSQKSQGARFVALRDGEKVEDAPVGAVVRESMKVTEIAKLVGKSIQHVTNCIAIHEAPPEIAPMIESDEVSSNAFTLASSGIKSVAAVVKILKAAIANAKDDGKSTATEKHVKAVKAQFAEPKPLKAAKKAGKSSSAPPQTPASDSKDESKDKPADVPFSSVEPEKPKELFTETPAAKKPLKSRAKMQAEIANLLERNFTEANPVEIAQATNELLEMFDALPFYFMDREQARKTHEAIKAFGDGKVVQYRHFPTDDWHDGDPTEMKFDAFEYRIKPEPREWWINIEPTASFIHKSKESAERSAQTARIECIHVREVI